MPVTIGERGRAVTPLRPTGYVEVNGTRLEAKLAPSRSISVESGTEVDHGGLGLGFEADGLAHAEEVVEDAFDAVGIE